MLLHYAALITLFHFMRYIDARRTQTVMSSASAGGSGGFWKPAPVSVDTAPGGGWKGDARNEDDVATMTPPMAMALSFSRAPLAQQRMLLPIYKHKRQILYAVEHYAITVICGETGSGKSTQIPQYLIETGGWAGGGEQNGFCVVCTQPRRIAAVSLAQRVAQETGTTQLGDKVGYSVRFDDKSSVTTQIKYVTDGLLLREASLGDPLLSNYSVVMVDEAHERNLNSDALLGLLKRIRQKRKGLRIIISSATIDAEKFLDFFLTNSNNSTSEQEPGTIISVDGRQHPVDILYLEKPARDYIQSMVETAWQIHCNESFGDILCFLPSGEDIDRAIRLAEERFHGEATSRPVDLLPLYGTLPLHMQTRVFQQSSATKQQQKKGSSFPRRIIWSTNIAETSLTVPNIRYVIDSGLVKLPYFDPRTALERLIVSPTSQASTKQRAGRAGRISAGKCFRLYTEEFLLQKMPQQTPPEILRTNLAGFILTLKALGIDNILAFDVLDIPSVESLSYGLELLHALGAIDDQIRLTDTGLNMSRFPVEPVVAKMLLESLQQSCAWEILSVAAALQVRDLFPKPRTSRQQVQMDYNDAMAQIADNSGDHVTYVNLLAEKHLSSEECRERFINHSALQRAWEVRKQLASCLRQYGRLESTLGMTDELRSSAIRKCVTAGFFGNVAKLSNDGRYYTLRQHILVTPSRSSVYATHATHSSEYIVFGESLDGPRGGIELKHVSAIEARWLREVAPHYWS